MTPPPRTVQERDGAGSRRAPTTTSTCIRTRQRQRRTDRQEDPPRPVPWLLGHDQRADTHPSETRDHQQRHADDGAGLRLVEPSTLGDRRVDLRPDRLDPVGRWGHRSPRPTWVRGRAGRRPEHQGCRGGSGADHDRGDRDASSRSPAHRVSLVMADSGPAAGPEARGSSCPSRRVGTAPATECWHPSFEPWWRLDRLRNPRGLRWDRRRPPEGDDPR